MSGLTITDSGLASVEVTFQIDSNGMLQVTAKEEATGEKAHIKVKNYAEYVKSQDGIALDVEEQSIQIGNEEEEEDTRGISGKVGFFQKLFGRRGNTKTPVSEDIAEVLQDELESNTTEVESEENVDMSQEEDSLDSLLGDDNLQEINLDDIEADMSLDELLADSSSEPLQFGMADSTALFKAIKQKNHLKRKNKVFQHMQVMRNNFQNSNLMFLQLKILKLKQSRYLLKKRVSMKTNTFRKQMIQAKLISC